MYHATKHCPPQTGEFHAGDIAFDKWIQHPQFWICIVSGSPGEWIQLAAAPDVMSLADMSDIINHKQWEPKPVVRK